MTRVLIEPAAYESVREAVDKVFALFPLRLAGKKVLIKPNVLRSSEAHEGITTHPSVVRAVVEKVETMGPASIVVGDNPGLFSYGANEEAFNKTGLMKAAKRYYRNIGNDSRKVAFNPDYMPEVSLSLAVLEADIIISLPKFKTHGLTVITGAIKNSFGFLPGAQKSNFHKLAGREAWRFHEIIVDIFRLRIPDLFIMDAIVGMQGNGPACSDLRDIGVVLASDNAVALDAVAATMMGCDPVTLPFLQRAKRLGLGDYNPASVEVIGELRQIPDFKLPPVSGEVLLSNEPMQAGFRQRAESRPHADPDLCTGCGTCVNQCPVSALTMTDLIPDVNPEKCIACFCCQEMCPKKAITLS